jgi:hypothetical protein
MPREKTPEKQRLKNKGGENLAAFTSRGGVLLEKTQSAIQSELCEFHSADHPGGFAAPATRRV